MLYLILYDITKNSVRTKIAKLLIKESYERLQLSVFLGNDDPLKNPLLWKPLNQLLKEDELAKFYIFPIPKNSLKNLRSIGNMDLDIDYLCGERESLCI